MIKIAAWRLRVSVFLAFLFLLVIAGQGSSSALQALLPQLAKWSFSEPPQTYLPESLFEYIDGAAESYLSYDFKELMVAQYKNEETGASLTLEIYDMGKGKNAFGIYSAERYPESTFLSIGLQGYWEEGALNFVTADKYIKLLCYDCGDQTESFLRHFAQEVDNKIAEKGSLPAALKYFPRENLIPNSEKFILHNFLGFSFLHDGYLANYRQGGLEFDLFLIEAANDQDAEGMIEQYLDSQLKLKQPPRQLSLGWQVRDRYAQNIYLAGVKNFIVGVMRIKDGFEETGEKYLQALARKVAE